MGVGTDLFEIISWDHPSFSVIGNLKCKLNNTSWKVITVYGSPYEEGKDAFVSELHSLFLDNKTPTLIGGDFNLVRYQKDKSNGKIDHKWCDKFNAWIEFWGLMEVNISSRKFTWANYQADLIMSTR